jgi:hypothetical protein
LDLNFGPTGLAGQGVLALYTPEIV